MLIRMFRRMVVWFGMSFLVSAAGWLGFLPLLLERLGFAALRGVWTCSLLLPNLEVNAADSLFRLMDLSSRFKGLSFGGLFWLYRLLSLCIWGVDNANVVGHVGRIIAGKEPLRLFEILLDGDLLMLIRMMISARGEGSNSVSKVKGHADDDLVRRGRVRLADKNGNDLADDAADRGRVGVRAPIQDARKDFIDGCGKWYPVIRELHRFFLAMARAVVNDDGKGGPRSHGLVLWNQAKETEGHGYSSGFGYGSGSPWSG